MKLNANEFYEKWDFYPMSGGVDPVIEPPVVEPPIEPPVEPTPPAVPPTLAPVVGLDTKLDGDQIPEELRGKSLSEVIKLLQSSKQTAQVPPPELEPVVEPQLTVDDMRVAFYQDPVGTVTKLVQMAVAPIVESMHRDKSEAGRQEISSRANYGLLQPDIDEFMTNVPAHLRANPKSWDIAYNYAKGKNFDKLIKPPTPVTPPELPPGTGAQGGGSKVNLSSEEKEAALKMGITEEDYAKWK